MRKVCRHPRVQFVSLGAEAVVPIVEETILIKSCDEVQKSPVKTLAAPSPSAYATPQPSPQPAMTEKAAACVCQPVDEINARIDQLSR
jgi:hypothetical protein